MRYIIFLIAVLFIPMNSYSFEYKGLDIKIRGNIGERFDDNITFIKNNKKEDFITELRLGLSTKYEGKTQTLELIGNINQQVFDKNPDFNNTSEDLTLNFQNEFSKYDRMSLRNAFTHAEEPRSFEDAFGRTAGRYSYYTNRFNLGYTKDLAKQLSITARYANEINEFSRAGLSDSYLNKIGGGLDYTLTSKTILLFSYDFANRKFDPGKDASTHTVATGLRQYITKQLYFDCKTGLDFISSYNNRDYIKPLFFASITDEIDENTRTGLSFTKEYSTNAYTQDIFDYLQLSGLFTKQLLERLSCSLSGFYGEGRYPSLNITDKLRGISAGLTYDFRENLKGDLSWTYSDVTSTTDTREYTKNTVSLGLRVEF